jgi:putative DNA primase/helicase
VCTEIERDKAVAEALVKQLTGGDRIKARFMRQDFFEFAPTHKIFLTANHKPVVRGGDHAIWRRIHLVPFTVTIPDAEQDRELPRKLIAEKAGILSWAVRGCLDWQRRGLGAPAEVLAATREYREEMDRLRDFFDERCILEPGASSAAQNLYSDYLVWCDQTREQVMTKSAFGRALAERGFVAAKTSGGRRVWRGLKLTGQVAAVQE